MQLHYLIVVIVVSDVSDDKVMSSTVAVIFAVVPALNCPWLMMSWAVMEAHSRWQGLQHGNSE